MLAKDGLPEIGRKVKVILNNQSEHGLIIHAKLMERIVYLNEYERIAWHYQGGSWTVNPGDEWEAEDIVKEIVPKCSDEMMKIIEGLNHTIGDNGEIYPIYECDKCHKWHIGD